ncbi:MAG: universal stress protein [Propionibacteriaceae bacterium]|jgi:nucleotide-binding universal stress UspA family protein|nr:universal stress protein [Propionibacteriaceae bacterium]
MAHIPPQPAPERITPFSGHPLVVGVVPGQSPIVAHTVASLATATGAPRVLFAYVDPSRYVVEECPDGSVRHESMSPDSLDDWHGVERALRAELTAALAEASFAWEVRYLAGRPDRALTHLARAVDAAAIVVGAKAPHRGMDFASRLQGSVAMHLAHHQHRPVITVPLSVVDWKDTDSPWAR